MRCGLRLWFKPGRFASTLVALGVLCDIVCGRGLSWGLCMWYCAGGVGAVDGMWQRVVCFLSFMIVIKMGWVFSCWGFVP